MSKSNFLRTVNYFIKDADWEKLEQDGMIEVYCDGMDWFMQRFFNQTQFYLTQDDCKFLRFFIENNLTTKEIQEYTTYKNPVVQMMKYMRFGIIVTIKEKGVLYYKLTPFGKKTLFKYEDYFAQLDD